MAKLKKPAGTWECSTCMVANKPEASKCVACDASKPVVKPKQPGNNSLCVQVKFKLLHLKNIVYPQIGLHTKFMMSCELIAKLTYL